MSSAQALMCAAPAVALSVALGCDPGVTAIDLRMLKGDARSVQP